MSKYLSYDTFKRMLTIFFALPTIEKDGNVRFEIHLKFEQVELEWHFYLQNP